VVMNQPVDEFVASFVGTETILEGRVGDVNETSLIVNVNESKIEVVGRGKPGEAVLLCIRPENVTISIPEGNVKTSARNVFRGRIIRIVPLGLFHRVEISCGFHLVAYVTTHALEDLALQEGMEVTASVKATAIHVIRKSIS
jgi:tungstate transport system ATP-binding protein